MKRTKIVYDDTGAAVGVCTAGTNRRTMTTYGYEGKHGAKIACPSCNAWNNASGVDELGWKQCGMCGRNGRFTR